MDANAKAITRARQIAKDFINRVGDWSDEKALSRAIEYMEEIYKLPDDPPRNCDTVKDHSDAIMKFEKWMGFSPTTADDQDSFFKEHWFEFAMWLVDMQEGEVSK